MSAASASGGQTPNLGDQTPMLDGDDYPKATPATHHASSHHRSHRSGATGGSRKRAADREKIHGAQKRKLHHKKAVPPYKYMGEELKKKLAKVDAQLKDARDIETKLQRKQTQKESQAHRDLQSLEGEMGQLDAELKELDKQIKAAQKEYAENDAKNVKEFEEISSRHRKEKEELQENIETVQERYHKIWRENYNLKMYHQMDSFWSKKEPEPTEHTKKIQEFEKRDALYDDAADEEGAEAFAKELEPEDEGEFGEEEESTEQAPETTETAEADGDFEL